MVASFFKSIGRGIVYFFTVPVFIIALVIYAIICFFGFLILMIKSIILFFRGKPLDYDLPEDIEAKKRLEMQSSNLYSNNFSNNVAPQPVVTQNQQQMNQNPYFVNQNNYQSSPLQNNENLGSNIQNNTNVQPQFIKQENEIINDNLNQNNNIIHEEDIKDITEEDDNNIESVSFDFEEDSAPDLKDDFNTMKINIHDEPKHENLDISDDVSEKDHHISIINEDDDNSSDDDDNDSGINISFGE